MPLKVNTFLNKVILLKYKMNAKIITKEEIFSNMAVFASRLRNSIFIAPTDTIYGLSANALDENVVKKVRKIKNSSQPFSIIPPSKEWIFENCEAENEKIREWIAKLPGPYTLILKLKNKNVIAKNVNNNTDTIGIRIPDHWISSLVSELGVPILTTSANKSGEQFMTNIDNLNEEINKEIDFILYENEKNAHPSIIIHLYGDEKIIKR